MDEKRVFNRCLRVGMAVLLGLLLICLGAVKGREQLLLLCLQWENEGRTWQTEGRKLADQWVEFIWNQKIKSRQSDEREGEDWSVLSFLDSLNPWYQRKMQEKENREDWKEPDPAYRDYLAARDFYIEHSYLIEENPEETEGQALAGSGGNGNQGNPESQTPALEGELSKAAYAPDGAPGKIYSLAQLADYDFLMKNFYNVHTSTTAGRDMMNAAAMLEKDFTLEKDASKPQILIYHTHSQEAFADSGPGENVVAVGDYLTELLEAKGFGVLHDRSVYDLKDGKLDRNQAYTYALEGISGILQENPDIQVILDIHRDGVGENVHLVTEVNGKPTAQIMFFNGLSQTPDGPVEYLPNPYRDDNLAFSFQLQLKAAAWYPGYTRKIYLKGLRYNLHLRPRSVLVEVGAQTNTYEEALNAMEPLAEIVAMVLEGT